MSGSLVFTMAGRTVAAMSRLAGTAGAWVVTDLRRRHGQREVYGSELAARAARHAIADLTTREWAIR